MPNCLVLKPFLATPDTGGSRFSHHTDHLSSSASPASQGGVRDGGKEARPPTPQKCINASPGPQPTHARAQPTHSAARAQHAHVTTDKPPPPRSCPGGRSGHLAGGGFSHSAIAGERGGRAGERAGGRESAEREERNPGTSSSPFPLSGALFLPKPAHLARRLAPVPVAGRMARHEELQGTRPVRVSSVCRSLSSFPSPALPCPHSPSLPSRSPLAKSRHQAPARLRRVQVGVGVGVVVVVLPAAGGTGDWVVAGRLAARGVGCLLGLCWQLCPRWALQAALSCRCAGLPLGRERGQRAWMGVLERPRGREERGNGWAVMSDETTAAAAAAALGWENSIDRKREARQAQILRSSS